MHTITAICREDGYPDVLIYTVTVAHPGDYAQVQQAIQHERKADLGDVAGEIEVLFCFMGDISPCVDFRE
jgi:hypothetical protein